MNFSQLKEFLPIYREFFRIYKIQIIFLVLLGLVLGLLEGISIGMLIPLFSFVTGGGDFGADLVSRNVKWLFGTLNIIPNLWLILGLFAGIVIINAGLTFLFGYLDHMISIDYERKIVARLYRDMLSSKWSFLLRHKIGHLEHMMMVGVPSQVKIIKKVFVIIQALTGFIMYFYVAFSISFSITLITAIFGMALLFILRPLLKRVRVYMQDRASISKSIAHDINESVTGLKTIKSMGVEEAAAEKILEFFRKLRDIHRKQFFASESVSVFWQPMTIIFVISIFSVSYLYQQNNFDLAAFAAIIYLVQRIFMHVSKLHGVMYSLNMAFPYAKMVIDLQEQARAHHEDESGDDNLSFKHAFEFRGVSFAYDGERPVLDGTTFSVKKGEMVGIIGKSGEGKTTICDLMLRLFTPQDGRLCLDGQDINSIGLKRWRENIGYVSQDIFLKNDTIKENIKFFDDDITDESMIKAAKTANIYDFVQTLPYKFDTVVGERGVLLSGGQRQRIILARVLARSPKILILDEATSALDNESEALVQEAIDKLKGEITIIVIAHRLSTVMRSDRLFVLEGGRMVEDGEPKALLADQGSRFHQMYNIIQA